MNTVLDAGFANVLRTCARKNDLQRGIKIHSDILKSGLLSNSPHVAHTLVNMYAKCGALAKAQDVHDWLPVQDATSWTALIAGYIEQGQSHNAWKCYMTMLEEGFSPDAVTLTCILKACGRIGAADRGGKIHLDITKEGLLDKNVMLGTALVDMYAKCGLLGTAARVLEDLSIRDAVSWNALISGCVRQEQSEDAVKYFERMEGETLSPDAVTFTCVLKAYGSLGELDRGLRIHHEIARQGLLCNSIFLGNALVDMYAKCGALTKARQVLENLPVQDVFTWNALIAGYAQQAQGHEALDCLQKMQGKGILPDVVTFTCILNACGSIKAADKGGEIHDEIVRQGLLENNIILGNAVVDMYAKCGAFAKANQVLKDLSIQDVSIWNALIAGYAQQGKGQDALDCFEEMQQRGLSPNAITYTCVLQACGSVGALDKGQQIHEKIAQQGLLASNPVLGNALVNMYVNCGALSKANRVVNDLPVRNTASWSALIGGYAEGNQGEEALICYERMKSEGLFPNGVIYSCVLKACGSIGAMKRGEQIHDEIVKQEWLGKDIVLGNTLVDMYAKLGALIKAQQVLEELPLRDVVSWNSLIGAYAQQGHGMQALDCYDQMREEGLVPDPLTFVFLLQACGSIGGIDMGLEIHGDIVRRGLMGKAIVLGTALVDMYSKCGALARAQEMLEQLPLQDVFSWNALIAGHAHKGHGEKALNCLESMQLNGVVPDVVTFMCVLKACGSIGAVEKGEELHDEISKKGFLMGNVQLGTALVDMYAKCGALDKARKLLNELPLGDMISWSALIAGLAQQGLGVEAMSCFQQMQREGLSPDAVTFTSMLNACSNVGAADKGKQIHGEIARHGLLGDSVALGNALIDMYVKCGTLERADQVLNELFVRDVVSWNALIAGFVQEGQGEHALECFESMQLEGLVPDAVTFNCLLKACGAMGAADKGHQIHTEIARCGLVGLSTMMGNALVNMYAKCGVLAKAEWVLEDMCVPDVITCSALIWGYARQGSGEKALRCFQEMRYASLSPDLVTFTNVLNACCHSGLFTQGQILFDSMGTEFCIKQNIEHCSRMVDLLGRAGHLDKAIAIIPRTLYPDNSTTWSALLGAFLKWGDMNVVGACVSEHVVHSDLKSCICKAGTGTSAPMLEITKQDFGAWKAGCGWLSNTRQKLPSLNAQG